MSSCSHRWLLQCHKTLSGCHVRCSSLYRAERTHSYIQINNKSLLLLLAVRKGNFLYSIKQIGKQLVCNYASHIHKHGLTNACEYQSHLCTAYPCSHTSIHSGHTFLISMAILSEIFGFERSWFPPSFWRWSITSRTCLSARTLRVMLTCLHKNRLEVKVRFLKR